MGSDLSVPKIKYVLYCIKSVTFQDNTVWNNPEFEDCLETYKRKTTELSVLKNYYPYVHTI